MRLGWVMPVAFVTSCVGFIPPATSLLDPMTHSPVDHVNLRGPFPVIVVSGDEAWIDMPEDPHNVPPPPRGASYLVPLDRARAIERYLSEHDKVHRKGSWVLNVKTLSPDRQRIELFILGDGYWGGAYEATATTVAPLYRKVTGPAFSLFVGGAALVMNTMLWVMVGSGIRLYRRRRTAAQQPRALDAGRAS